jgi:hypothetical protein
VEFPGFGVILIVDRELSIGGGVTPELAPLIVNMGGVDGVVFVAPYPALGAWP